MAACSGMVQAIEIREIQQLSQLEDLDRHCRALLRGVHPDKVDEARRKAHTGYTQDILAAKVVVKEIVHHAAEVVQTRKKQSTLSEKQAPLVRPSSPFTPHSRARPESFRTLPAGWESWWDEEEQRTFYWNPGTKQTQWEWPISRAAALLEQSSNYERCPLAAMPHEQARLHRPLPPGWERWWAKKECMFAFHQIDTGNTQWLYPEGAHA